MALVVVVAVAACAGDDGPPGTGASATSTSSIAAPPTTSTSTTSISTTTQPATTTTTTAPPPAPAPAGRTLRHGDRGPAVQELQRRLAELGYWTGGADGMFGWDTHHAVVALQKAAGLERDGVVGPRTRRAVDNGVRPGARSHSGRVVEIDLQHQLLLSVRDGRVEEIFDTSTGSVSGSTPPGHWTVTWEIDGLRRSPLGLLYRPKYFRGGVAIHGFTSVPPYPASHGCVRVTYPAMDHIWAAGLMPVGTPVWVY